MFKLARIRQSLALLAGLAFATLAQAQYTFTTFAHPSATGMQGWGINSALRVPANTASSATPVTGFVYDYSTDSFTPLPSPGGGLISSAVGINNAGILVGAYTDGSFYKAYVLTGSVYDTFSYPGSLSTFARAINNTGLVTGYAELSTAPLMTTGYIRDTATGSFTAIAPTGSVFTIAQGVNDAGVVVGGSNMVPGAVYPGSPAGPYGWVRQSGGTITFFRVNGLPTRARGINNAGEIVGWISDATGTFVQSFKVTVSGAPYEDITVPAADLIEAPGFVRTIAEGINDAGFISGSVYDAAGISQGFVAAPPVPMLLEGLALMIEGFNLPKGIANSFLVKVKAAANAFDKGDIEAACGNLKALINHAEAQSGKKLTVAQANQIISSATTIRATLGC